MDKEIRELEREVLRGDASALPRLRRAYLRATGPLPPLAYVQLPGGGPISARAHRRPFYDRVAIRPTPAGGTVDVQAFYMAVGGLDPHDERRKTTADTNMDIRGLVPYGNAFFWSGVSVVPDSGSDAQDVEAIWNACTLEYERYGTGPTSRWPCRVVMTAPAELPQDAEGVLRLVGAAQAVRDVRVPGRRRVMRNGRVREITGQFPIEIEPQTNARFRIVGRLEQPIRRAARLMVVLHGIGVSGQS